MLALFCAIAISFGQVPQGINYQTVVRNNNGAIIPNQNVSFRFSVRTDSPTGSIVYQETHTAATNTLGLVNLVLGQGTPQQGIFTSIIWGSTSHFLSVEFDVAGGTNYSLSGTSQLLSVPYALFAANSPTGATGATGSQGPAGNDGATGPQGPAGNDGATGPQGLAGDDGATGPQGPTGATGAAGVGGVTIAGNNVTITGAGTTASPYVVNAAGTTTLTIGQSYQGGIIFWLDATDQHGLIVATADQHTGIEWYNGTYRHTGTTGDGLYAGAMNTAIIVATQMADNQTGNFAAKVCADYSVTDNGVTYGDWYLPSKYELDFLYQQRNAVGGFTNQFYWTSTEFGVNHAWGHGFINGAQAYNNKDYPNYVRAIRAF